MILVSSRCAPLLLLASLTGCDSYVLGGGLGGQAGSNGGGDDPGIIDNCATFYEDFESTGEVSFRHDLVPILQNRCNAPICHGGLADAAQAGLWLGPDPENEPSKDDLWFVYRTLIDVQSTVAPRLALVRPGDPGQSYFMRKLDDCYEPSGLDCTLDTNLYGAPCGQAMPVLTGQLSAEERDLFRSWIANGAPEN